MSENTKYKEITANELDSLLIENADIILLHTMIESQFLKIRIPKSRQACVFEVNFVEQVKAITSDNNNSIVVYGADSETMDAPVAAEKLAAAGYKNIAILVGGIAAWKMQGLPIEGTSSGKNNESAIDIQFVDEVYTVDCEKSNIGWTGRNPNSSHYGNVSITSGKIQVVDGKMTGEIEIDMNSILNINLAGDESQPVLIDHLKSDDFFHTDLFPIATFEINQVKPLDEQSISAPNFQIDGTLMMHGVMAKQSFPATLSLTENGALSFEAHFDLDRTRWNIIYGSAKFFKHLGMHLVFDHISIELRVITSVYP